MEFKSLHMRSARPSVHRRLLHSAVTTSHQRRAQHATYNAPYQVPEQAPALRASGTDQLRQSLNITAKEKVMQLIAEGHDNYNPGELGPAVAELLVSCPIAKDQLAAQSFVLGQGTWEVFYAPHIASMSSVLGTKFQIQYALQGSSLSSYVKYSSPVGSGWLNAAGSMGRKYDDTVEISFDRFWVDGADALRSDIPAGQGTAMDNVMSTLGRTAFFPQLAIFPVHYLDADLCVFEFPPLNSKIAVRRVA